MRSKRRWRGSRPRHRSLEAIPGKSRYQLRKIRVAGPAVTLQTGSVSGPLPGIGNQAAEVNAMQSLAGKVALVTGASSGIGQASARLFAREGGARGGFAPGATKNHA